MSKLANILGGYPLAQPFAQSPGQKVSVSKKPKLGQSVVVPPTAPAYLPADYLYAYSSSLRGYGGVPIAVNGGGMWGWGLDGFSYLAPTFGHYSTYRMMCNQSTLSLAKKLFCDSIITLPMSVEAVDRDVPDEWLELVKAQTLPHMQMVMQAALDSLVFGWQPFEKIWSVKKNQLWCRLRPLAPEYSTIYIDEEGNYAGLGTVGDQGVILTPNKSLIITHEPNIGLYGRSRLDAAYEPFVAWQKGRIDQKKLRDKLSGILPMLYYPPGEQPDGTPNEKIAQDILQELGKGNAVALPSVQFDMDQIALDSKLASVSLWRLDFYDAGNLAPAQTGLIDELTYNDVLLFRAWGLPERSGMESQNGSKADAVAHSDNSVMGKEQVAASIAYQLTNGNPFAGVQGWVDDILRYNFGEDAVGTIVLKPAPLSDYKLAYKADILKQLIVQNTPASVALLKAMNINNLLEDFGIELADEGFDVDEFTENVQVTAPMEPVQSPKPLEKQTPGASSSGENKQVSLSRNLSKWEQALAALSAQG